MTGTTPVVHADLDPNDVGNVHASDAVTVDLPDGRTVPGTVFSVAATTSTSTARRRRARRPTDRARRAAPRPSASTSSSAGSTSVRSTERASRCTWSTSKVDHTIAVPVKSLLALAEGGYGVERERGGRRALVAVKPGVFAGGFVQVRATCAPGDRVVTP